jgi:signal transduction histidine kinase
MRRFFSIPDDDNQLWPVLLLLLVVMIPTACIVWFTKKAIHTERLAARQKLHEAYTSHLFLVAAQVNRRVSEVLDRLEAVAAGKPHMAAFVACVEQNLADSVACFESDGRLAYPDLPPPVRTPPAESSSWTEAQRLEWEARDYPTAAAAYAMLSEQSASDVEIARARQGQVRCLANAGQTQEAIELIVQVFGEPTLATASDEFGRSIAANAELFGLELAGNAEHPAFAVLARRLIARLTDYEAPSITSVQRRFLWQELDRWHEWPELCENGNELQLAAAEKLIGPFAEQHPMLPKDHGLRPAGTPGLWRIVSPRRRLVALMTTDRVMAIVEGAIAGESMPEGLSMDVLPPEQEPEPNRYWLLKIVAAMPGWRLGLKVHDYPSEDEYSWQRASVHLWTAVVVISTMLLLALLIGGAFRRQLRLARLKNDLVATVTHELKTPLSSIRLLVDTLLDSPHIGEPKVREYLQLVAKENSRLTRLIDNFLTFSRMERKKHSFLFVELECRDVVQSAIEAAGERFQGPECELAVEVDDDLPALIGDFDALITVLLNLLDNAYKYTLDKKRIKLQAFQQNGSVCFAVSDNGIGLSRAASRRVFERFFQVDQSLSRQASGCGLGLSIVKYIVDAHEGTIQIQSQPGMGSTFTVCLPRVAQRAVSEPAVV